MLQRRTRIDPKQPFSSYKLSSLSNENGGVAHQIYSSLFLALISTTRCPSSCAASAHIVFTTHFLTGPLTPAPITLGSSSLPIEYIMPMMVEMRKASMTPVPTNNQNGVEMSFF